MFALLHGPALAALFAAWFVPSLALVVSLRHWITR